MPIYYQSQLEEGALLNKGIRVESAAALILASAVTKFTVSGGNVLMTGFYGEIMVDIANTGCVLSVIHTPTVGTATTIAAAGGGTDIKTYVAGRCCLLPAALTGIMTYTATGYGLMTATKYILRPGILSVTGTGAPATGTIRWFMFYVPVDYGAYVTGS